MQCFICYNNTVDKKQYRTARCFLPPYRVQAKWWADVCNALNLKALSAKLSLCYHDGIQNYLLRYLSALHEAERNPPPVPAASDADGAVWVCWFQGYDCAPDIVKKCITSIRAHSGGRKVILLTEETMLHYVDIPNAVVEKYKDGIITKTHFSNLVRTQLLYRYGGLWIDATIMITHDLEKEIFSCPLYTIKKPFSSPYTDYNCKPSLSCSAFRWTGYFMAALKGSLTPYIISAILFAYWAENNKQVEFFLYDEIINFCYEHSDIVRSAIDGVPFNNPDVNFFSGITQTNEAQVRSEITAALSKTFAFKLSYKVQYPFAVQKILDEMLPTI